MFSHKLFNVFIAVTLTIVAIGSAPLAGIAFADGPNDANAFIAELDNLRQLGQAEAAAARVARRQQIAVFDHSGQLSALHARSVAVRVRGTTVASANDFTTHLDRLRVMGQTDANTFVARLDQLRQRGIEAAQTPSQLAAR